MNRYVVIIIGSGLWSATEWNRFCHSSNIAFTNFINTAFDIVLSSDLSKIVNKNMSYKSQFSCIR